MRNSEIDRLKDEMNRAFDEKQRAFDRMKRAGDERFRLKDQLEDSWEDVLDAQAEMNDAYERQQSEWDEYKREREYLSREIDAVKDEAQEAHECMKECYGRASDAYEYRDGASAKAYSEDARGYKERRDDFNREAARLIEMAKNLDRPDSQLPYYKNRYDRKKDNHQRIQSQYRRAKENHEDLKEDFDRAKEHFDYAKEAFNRAKEAEENMWYDKHCKECGTVIRCRKDWDNPPNYCKDCKERFLHKRKKSKEKALMRVRGEFGYFDGKDAKIVDRKSGKADVYYGGIINPDGIEHGHIVINDVGGAEYLRRPGQDKKDADIDSNRLKNPIKR